MSIFFLKVIALSFACCIKILSILYLNRVPHIYSKEYTKMINLKISMNYKIDSKDSLKK